MKLARALAHFTFATAACLGLRALLAALKAADRALLHGEARYARRLLAAAAGHPEFAEVDEYLSEWYPA